MKCSWIIPNLKKEESNDYQTKNDDLQDIEKKEEIQTAFFDFFKCFDEYIEKGKLTKTTNTIKGQTTARNYLQTFFEKGGFRNSFEVIDEFFFEEIMDYSYNVKKVKQTILLKSSKF